MKTFFSLLIAALFLAITQLSHATSFDCAKATSKVEKMICGDAELSKLDDRLAQTYEAEQAKAGNANQLKMNQLNWMKTRNQCTDAACIKTTYVQRLAKFKDNSFSGQWYLELCSKNIKNQCGGFTVYLVQLGNKICGDHFFVTPKLGRMNEGAPHSITGIANQSTANLFITSGRNGAVLQVRAIKKNSELVWNVIKEIKPGVDAESALILDHGKLNRITEDERYQAVFSECKANRILTK